MDDQVYISDCLGKGRASDFRRAADMYEASGNKSMAYLCLLRALDLDPSLRDVYEKLRDTKNPMILNPMETRTEEACAISIIMCTLGRSPAIRESIQSVLTQTFDDFELIVINDGGSCEIANVIASFASDKIRYHIIEHKGLAPAMNEGLRRARGKYICYLDDDDIYYPEHLQTVWSEVCDGGFRWAYAKSRTFNGKWENSLFVKTEDLGSYTKSFSRINIQYGCIMTPLNVIHERSFAFEMGGFNEDLLHSMDWDMWVRMAQIATPKFIDIFTGEYRKTATSMTMSNKEFGLFLTQLLSRYYQTAFGKSVLLHAAKEQGHMADVDNILTDIEGKYSTISRVDIKKLLGLFVELKKGRNLWRKMIQEQPEELVSESFKLLWQYFETVRQSKVFPWKKWFCEVRKQPVFLGRILWQSPALIWHFLRKLAVKSQSDNACTERVFQQGCPVVVFAVDRRFVMALAAALKSMEENSRRYEKLNVWIIDGGIGGRNRSKIEHSVDCNKLIIHWVMPDRDIMDDVPLSGHITKASYYRILMPSLLPRYVDKAVHVDVDVIFTGDIGDLWDVEFGDHAVLAVSHAGSSADMESHKALGLPVNAEYLSAGLLVFNMPLWREERISQKVLSFIHDNKEKIRWHDQDALNAVLCGNWGKLAKCWFYWADCSKRDDGELMSKIISGQKMEEIKLVHFAGSMKPWHYEAVHSGKELFFKYLDKTAWSGWRPRRPVWRIFWRNAGRTWLNRHFYGMWIRRIPMIGKIWTLIRK